jgi:adenylate kinase family enzyme
MAAKATVPAFAAITGMPYSGTTEQAEALAKDFNALCVKESDLPSWGSQAMPELQRFLAEKQCTFCVLDNLLTSQELCEAFVKQFGEPRALLDLKVPDEQIAELAERRLGESFDAEAVQAELEAKRAGYEALGAYATANLKGYSGVDGTGTFEQVYAELKKKLMPKTFVVVAPGARQFGRALGAGLTTGAPRGQTFTLINAESLPRRGNHSAEIEEELARYALVPGEVPGQAQAPLPTQMWVKLFAEAFANSADPLGSFVVVNFPTLTSVAGFPTPRDQLDALEQISSLEGLVSIEFVTDLALRKFCFGDGNEAALSEYKAYAAQVNEFIDLNYAAGADSKVVKIEVDEEDDNVGSIAGRVAKDFFSLNA